MPDFVLVIASLLPVALLLLFIWKRDPIKEPTKQLRKALGWGVTVSFPIVIVEMIIKSVFFGGGEPTSLVGTTFEAFFVAALPEESFKLLALWIVVRKNPYFDEHIDGVVYAVFVSLGFAGLENILYVFGNAENWVQVSLSRALLAVPGHYAFGVLMGYYYSLYCFVNPSTRNFILVLLAPVLAHGFYDALILSGQVDETVGGIAFFVLVWFCYKLHRYCLKRIEAQVERDKQSTVDEEVGGKAGVEGDYEEIC
jgi:RsiW-degrading membrane proteinase PrsW (M82 family)